MMKVNGVRTDRNFAPSKAVDPGRPLQRWTLGPIHALLSVEFAINSLCPIHSGSALDSRSCASFKIRTAFIASSRISFQR